MIRLKNVSKYYKKKEGAAVSNLNLHVEEGKICVMVGPSGCGKTTTLKMINRIIEPSDGNIYVNDKNVMEQNPNELRLKIGYVIQKIGLFPHYTVYENVATVPKLLGWKEEKIRNRANELLKIVGLSPQEYAKKYPNQLSGGQKQRVGVARAMAANPPVMLMDEPFGAVDPITRNQLQNEFLKIQKKMKKTICFVTHDIDEAIKMGDKIAIMCDGKLVQYDTPENILFSPKNEFVEEFVGSDRALKVLNLLKVDTILDTSLPKISIDTDSDVLKKLALKGQDHVVVLDDEEKLVGYIKLRKIVERRSLEKWDKYIKRYVSTIDEDSSLKNAMVSMLQFDVFNIPVISENGVYKGIVNFNMIKSYISEEYETNNIVDKVVG